jgi:hypothetical protein
MAKFVRFRRSHLRVVVIMAAGRESPSTSPARVPKRVSGLARAGKGQKLP